MCPKVARERLGARIIHGKCSNRVCRFVAATFHRARSCRMDNRQTPSTQWLLETCTAAKIKTFMVLVMPLLSAPSRKKAEIITELLAYLTTDHVAWATLLNRFTLLDLKL